MDENKINMDFMFGEPSKDTELCLLYKEIDSVHNLNNNPLAVRAAALKAARRAFRLGIEYAVKQKITTL